MTNFDYNTLLPTLAAKLSVSEGALRAALASGDPKSIAALLSGEQAQTFSRIMSDPDAVRKVLNSKQAKDFQQNIGK